MKIKKTVYLVSLFYFIILSSCLGQNSENIFESDIRSFEEMDEKNMPEPGGILFVGSSSIRSWQSLSEDFPKRNVLNRGFGGSQIADVIYFFDRVVVKYQPRQIVLYSGDNDVASGKSVNEVFDDFMSFRELIKKNLPGTELVFLSIKPSTLRWNMYGDMEEINRRVEKYALTDDYVTFVDVSSDMLTDEGVPDETLLLEDGIHMTKEGYSLWIKILEPFLSLE